jgi:hypothetical protein
LGVGGRNGAPTYGVEESLEAGGRVEFAGNWRREVGSLQNLSPGVYLPDDRQLIAETIVLNR